MKKILFFAIISTGILINSCSVTSAKLTDVKMCESIEGNTCGTDVTSFTKDTPIIYCSCVLKNAPDATKVKFSWYYLEGKEQLIDDVELSSPASGSNHQMQSSLSKPNNGWPAGSYKVVIQIMEADNRDPVEKKFSVK